VIRARQHILNNTIMKTNYKPQSILLTAALAALLSCENRSAIEAPSTQVNVGALNHTLSIQGSKNISFDGSEGDPLALGTALKWTANYRTTQPNDTYGHFFGNQIIKQILREPGCVGIRIHYAIDDAGAKKLLLVGVNANGENLLPTTMALDSTGTYTIADWSWPCPPCLPLDQSITASHPVNISFDGSEGDPLSLSTAQKWTANYRSLHPNGTFAHFFGQEIINQILSEQGCIGIRIYYALDETGAKKLLLVGSTAIGENLLPRSTTLDVPDPNTVADWSWPCPPCIGG
jgi:hypothetical protein